MLAATFWERLQEAPWMALKIAAVLLGGLACWFALLYTARAIWLLLTRTLRIPGSVIGASILASISLWWGWGAVQEYAHAKAILATGISPDPNVPVEQACRDLNGEARVLAFFAFMFAGFAIWLIWRWGYGIERERLLSMTERERLVEKAKDVMNHGP
jgi:hypothetical protein